MGLKTVSVYGHSESGISEVRAYSLWEAVICHCHFTCHGLGSSRTGRVVREGHSIACSNSFIHGVLLVSLGGIKTFLRIVIHSPSRLSLSISLALPLATPLHLLKWSVFVGITLILETFPAVFTNDDNLIQ